jgi:hypothetical protein
MKEKLFLVVIILTALFLGNAFAKRGPAPVVAPVIYEGIRYEAPNTPQKMGYIEAFDAATGEKLWEKKAYEITFDQSIEQDVQWVFIEKLQIEGKELVVIDENGKACRIDLPRLIARRHIGDQAKAQVKPDEIVIFAGSFPHDANKADPDERLDVIIAEVKDFDGRVLGTVQSRDKNLKLVYVSEDGRSKIIWRYADYAHVFKMTFDAKKRTLRLYDEHTLLWTTHSVISFNIDSFKRKNKRVKFGK